MASSSPSLLSNENSRETPPSPYSPVSHVYLAVLFALILGHNALFHSLVLPHLSLSFLQSSFSVLQFIRNIVELGLIALIMQILDRPLATWLHRPWNTLGGLRAISAVLLAMTLLSFLLQSLGSFALPLPFPALLPTPPALTQTLEANSWSWMLLNSVLLTPIREELFFRGVLWTLLQRRWGSRLASIQTALLFAGAHLPGYDLSDFILQFAFGCVLGQLLPHFGLLVCMAAHMSVNALAFASHPVAAPGRLWLTQHPVTQACLVLFILTLFFRGLIDWVLRCRRHRLTSRRLW